MTDEGHVERALRSVVRDHGWGISEDPRRLRASLSDVLGAEASQHRGEVDALVIAADEGIPAAVRDGGAAPDHVARLEVWGLAPELAAWAVATWVAAIPATGAADLTAAPRRPAVGGPVLSSGPELTALPALHRTAPAPVPAPAALPPVTPPGAPGRARPRWRRGVLVGVATGFAVMVVGGTLAAVVTLRSDGSPESDPSSAPPSASAPTAQGQELVSDPEAQPRTLPHPVAMASKRVGVSVEALSEVPEMHVRGRAVLPPEGGKLVAFRLGRWDCQLDTSCGPGRSVHVEVDGQPRRLHGRGPYVVAVPAGATAADLVMTADGITQRISLLTGRPGRGNIEVLARPDRVIDVDQTFDLVQHTSIPIYYIDGHDGTYDHTLNVTVRGASLDYFVAGRSPRAPRHAFLSVSSWYTYDEDPRKAGHEWAFDEPLLTFVGSDGVVYRAVDLTPDKGYATQAFEVPADIRGGHFVIGGPQRVTNTASNGARYTVTVERHEERLRF